MTSQTDADKNKEAPRIVKHVSKSTTPAKKGKREAKVRPAAGPTAPAPAPVAPPCPDLNEPTDEPFGEPVDEPVDEADVPVEEADEPVDEADVPVVEAMEAVGVVERVAAGKGCAGDGGPQVAAHEKRESLLDVLARVERSCA